MSHSIAQELTMVSDFTDVEDAENKVSEMCDRVANGEDAADVLNDEGLEACQAWIDELEGND